MLKIEYEIYEIEAIPYLKRERDDLLEQIREIVESHHGMGFESFKETLTFVPGAISDKTGKEVFRHIENDDRLRRLVDQLDFITLVMNFKIADIRAMTGGRLQQIALARFVHGMSWPEVAAITGLGRDCIIKTWTRANKK